MGRILPWKCWKKLLAHWNLKSEERDWQTSAEERKNDAAKWDHYILAWFPINYVWICFYALVLIFSLSGFPLWRLMEIDNEDFWKGLVCIFYIIHDIQPFWVALIFRRQLMLTTNIIGQLLALFVLWLLWRMSFRIDDSVWKNTWKFNVKSTP